MGQLREKIRQMVRNEFAARILQEAEKDDKYSDKTVYRSSKYVDIWNDIPLGKPTTEITPTPTKHDFVRRIMNMLDKADRQRSTSAIHLDSKQKRVALNLLRPLVNNPDEFVETMNKERGIVFGQAGDDSEGVRGGKLRSHGDPVAYLVTQYKSDKDVLKSLEGVEADAPPATIKADTDGEYDIIPGTTSKANIARMLAKDPTETTTEMSVLNRLTKAMKHLTNEKNMAILAFIKDPDVNKADKLELMSDLEKIQKLANVGASKYSEMFVDAQIAAAKGIKDVEDFEEVEEARTQGYKKFVAALRAAGTFSPAVNRDTINPEEYSVFDAALDKQEGRFDIHSMLVLAAKKPERAALFRDEAIASVKDTFLDEMGKQTNFNTLGDFTDTMPEMKEARQNVFNTLERRGRKPGSTKEVLAARKAAAAEED